MEEAVSVSDLTKAIRLLLEEGIGDVVVEGEITNYKHHSSGHRYFTLKDEDASIQCVMWKSRNINFIPEDGMRVLIFGRLSVYPPQGRYQIDCTTMRPFGLGDLHVALEQLKKKLLALGWFDEARKRPLPTLPMRIGVITSPTGAALHDIISTIRRRLPVVEIVFRPALVQGDGSAEDIAKAIAEVNRVGADVLIVGRGGGSIEDLWSFNTEIVAEAIVMSDIPVVSAVGHETDWTIADGVADRRAATPTAAAEMVTPFTTESLLQTIAHHEALMLQRMSTRVARVQEIVTEFRDGTTARRLTERVHLRAQRVDELTSRMARGAVQHVAMLRRQVEHVAALCATLHPLAPLRRGYAIVERNGHILSTTDKLIQGESVQVRRHNEIATVTVNTREDTRANLNE
ncbi:MAG: exodeoxyribonuclease VII large subunit [bacterium]|nr:exodeoxyribonuclease VII large subunit [bacterium]